jgi:hypothetical protein
VALKVRNSERIFLASTGRSRRRGNPRSEYIIRRWSSIITRQFTSKPKLEVNQKKRHISETPFKHFIFKKISTNEYKAF